MTSPQNPPLETPDFDVGDIICFIENHSNGDRLNTYGLITERKKENNRDMIRIKWFDDWTDTWHLDPSNGPKHRIKNFFVISKNKSQPHEYPQEGD